MDQRAKPRPDASRYAWLSAGAPILGLVLLVALLALVLLLSFARQQDRYYSSGTRQLMSSAIEAKARALGTLAIDYANWDAAYGNITRRFNRAWLDRNFYSSIADALIVFRPGQSPRYVWFMEDSPANVTMQVVDAAAQAPNLSALAGAEEPPDGMASTFVEVGGRLAVVSIAPITPEDHAARRALSGSADIDYLIAVNFLDAERLNALGADLNLSNVNFSAGNPGGPDVVTQPVIAANGAPVGVLSWTHAHPGGHGLLSRMWIAIIGLALAGLLAVLIARTLVRRQVANIVRAETALESSRLKSEFIATMSHELRTPLNAIIGYAELIQEECAAIGGEAAEMRTDATRIVTAGRHLSQLINDILDQSRLDAGHLHLQIEPLNAGDLIAEIGEIIEPLARANGAQLDIARSADLVMADHARLRQCLINLAGNAVKFARKGRVSLSARRSDDGERIIFDVSDSGIGISAEEISRLFEPFVQANQNVQARFGGAGLGLAISRKLARAMGGDISVVSDLGEGSTFSLSLPAMRLAAQPLPNVA
jgi:signal transduction histidine kinase